MQITIRNLLLTELSNRRNRNKLYSLRAYARDLGIGIGSLSEVLSEKRDFSKANLVKILRSFNITQEQKEILLNRSKPHDSTSAEMHQLLLEDQFKLISDWYYLAILNLAKLKTNRAQPAWISKRLNIELYLCIEAVERLKRLQLLKIENNRLIRTSLPLTTSHDLPSMAIRKHHSQNLHLAQASLHRDPVHLREFGSVTMTVNVKNLPKVKNLLLKMRKKAADLLEDSSATEVYTLSFQLFPLTKVKTAVRSKTK